MSETDLTLDDLTNSNLTKPRQSVSRKDAFRSNKMYGMDVPLESSKIGLSITDEDFSGHEDLPRVVDGCGDETERHLKIMVKDGKQKRDRGNLPNPESGKYAILIATGNYTGSSGHKPLRGPKRDLKCMRSILQKNNYEIHEIVDVDNILKEVKSAINVIGRENIKLMHVILSGHGAYQDQIPAPVGEEQNDGVAMMMHRDVVDVAFGVNGHASSILNIVQVVTGSKMRKSEPCARPDALFNFLWDFYTNGTRSGPTVRSNLVEQEAEFQNYALNQRILEIYSAQNCNKPSDGISLVQRICHVINNSTTHFLHLSELIMSGKEADQTVCVNWPPVTNPDFNFRKLTFPLGAMQETKSKDLVPRPGLGTKLEATKHDPGIPQPEHRKKTDSSTKPSGTSTLQQDETDDQAKQASMQLDSNHITQLVENFEGAKLNQSSNLDKPYPISSKDFPPKKLQQLVFDLHSHSFYMEFDKANPIYQEITRSLQTINGPITPHDGTSLAQVFNELAFNHYQKYDYSDAFDWSMKAVELLSSPAIPEHVLVDVLRNASNICIQKSEFAKAKLLITEALRVAKQCYGENHRKYIAMCLIDYGRYLQSEELVSSHAIESIKTGVDLLSNILGENNAHVAIAYGELAYALYRYEHNTNRNYKEAKHFADKSLEILNNLLPSNHILFAPRRRHLGVILEAMAWSFPPMNTSDLAYKQQLYKEAETQYLIAKETIVTFFDEKHSLTANIFADLGNLYRNMNRWQESEQFLLKSIDIMESIHGPEHVEVSRKLNWLGHLYNYNMEKLDKAEKCYLRNIAINLKLFGPDYSQLKYNYEAMIYLYLKTENDKKAKEMGEALIEWKKLREKKQKEEAKVNVVENSRSIPLVDIIDTVTKKIKLI